MQRYKCGSHQSCGPGSLHQMKRRHLAGGQSVALTRRESRKICQRRSSSLHRLCATLRRANLLEVGGWSSFACWGPSQSGMALVGRVLFGLVNHLIAAWNSVSPTSRQELANSDDNLDIALSLFGRQIRSRRSSHCCC
jgi:hypothetical protein